MLLLIGIVAIPAFSFVTLTLHITNFHRYHITVITTPTISIIITSTVLCIIYRTESSLRLLSIIYSQRHSLRIIYSCGIMKQYMRPDMGLQPIGKRMQQLFLRCSR